MLLQRAQWSELSGQHSPAQDSRGTVLGGTPRFPGWVGGSVPRTAAV